jgi:hypothetical protein
MNLEWEPKFENTNLRRVPSTLEGLGRDLVR